MSDPDQSLWKVLDTVALLCVSTVVAISVVALLGWSSGVLVLAQGELQFVPMPPSAALVFLILSVSWFALRRSKLVQFRVASYIGAAVVISICSDVILFSLGAVTFNVESFLVHDQSLVGGYLIGRMSPVAAVAFLLASISILMFAYSKNQFFKGVGLALGVTVFSLGFVFSIGYLLGVPILYGSTIRPVALPSALAFILLGVSLVASVGPAYWPWNELLGSSLRSRILRPFLVLSVAIVVSYGWFSRNVFALANPALLTALVLLGSLVIVGAAASRIAVAVANSTEQALRKSVSETAAMVGHDLRNPLQGIAGAANILSERLGSAPDEITKQMLGLIQRDVEYSNKIVVDLVEFSGTLRFQLAEVSLKKMIEEALDRFDFPQNVQVRNMIGHDDEVVTDPQKIKRVFANLIGNALDAMPSGGELTISDRRSDSRIEVTFEDTGQGMKREVMDSLWKGFTTTKAKGLGLGLVTSKRIVEGLGGSISVQSTLGKGTVLVVSLPRRAIER